MGFWQWIETITTVLSNLAIIATAGFILWQAIINRDLVRRTVQQYRENLEQRRKELEFEQARRQESLEQRRKELALEFMRRWNDPVFSDRRKWILRFLGDKMVSFKQKMDYITDKEHLERGAEYLNLLNFLEEFSIAVNSNLADEELARRFFYGVILRHGEVLRDFVQDLRRETSRASTLSEFTTLVTRWSALPPPMSS